MTTITTDLRNTIEEARRFRYEPTLPITATDMQTAIDQSVLQPKTINPTAVNFAMSPYAPTNADSYLLVDTSGGAVVINLQAAALRAGLPLAVKDNTGNAVANPISLVPAGGETIDGLAPYPIDANFAAVQIAPRAGGYFVTP